MAKESVQRPEVVDWGIIGENTALREINTDDPVDLERYWETNQSVPAGYMVDDIETMEELVANAQSNGPENGYTLAISGTMGQETGEFQGFVQLTPDYDNEFRYKIEQTGLFSFLKDVVLWEVSYAKYPPAAPHQVASAVRQACVLLAETLGMRGFYPRIAIMGSSNPDENPDSFRVLDAACFEPIAATKDKPMGIIRYSEQDTGLDSVWLLNWNTLHRKLREKTAAYLKRKDGGG